MAIVSILKTCWSSPVQWEQIDQQIMNFKLCEWARTYIVVGTIGIQLLSFQRKNKTFMQGCLGICKPRSLVLVSS